MKPSCFLLEGASTEQAGAKQLQAGNSRQTAEGAMDGSMLPGRRLRGCRIQQSCRKSWYWISVQPFIPRIWRCSARLLANCGGAAGHAPTQGQMDWLCNNLIIRYDHYVVSIFLRGILYRLKHIWEVSQLSTKNLSSWMESCLAIKKRLCLPLVLFCVPVYNAGRWWGGNWRSDCTAVAEIRAIHCNSCV